MAAVVVIVLYACIGFAVAVVVVLRGRGKWGSPVIAGVLWPFVLPTLHESAAANAAGGLSDRARRLDRAAAALRVAWAARADSLPGQDGRERDRLDGFIDRLRGLDQRVRELDEAMTDAPPALKEKLDRLRERTCAEFEQGLATLEDLCAQLTLLRFATVGQSADRMQLEALLARIAALAEVSLNDAALAPMSTESRP